MVAEDGPGLGLEDQVSEWITADPDEECRTELADLLRRAIADEQARGELEDRFARLLQFGTAGLRGVMAAGPNRMNRAVVRKAAWALIRHLQQSLGHGSTPTDECAPPTVVIGSDARHHSREFALDTAGVITAAGGRALLLPVNSPTPLLAYAVRTLSADAGVMVTASHNPAADNGYKVYLGGRMVADCERGTQIIAPHDGLIAALMEASPPANLIPLGNGWTDVGEEFSDQYIAAIATGPRPSVPLRIVHTAMHGVGSATALEALAQAGFADVHSVPEQAQPDPDFPTVAFPNPEEPGAIDLALEFAAKVDADLVIANDPDADRCAVAVNDPRCGWRILHGDELGALLGVEAAGHPGALLVSSLVSSRQLSLIAEEHDVGFETTLTGFKWMGRVPGMTYAYEEAIGYCVRPDLVHDKDGISTAVAAAQLAARLKADGYTLIDALDDLARRHGLYLSSQLAHRFADLGAIVDTMARLRATPPRTLAGAEVVEWVDLGEGYHGLPPTEGILLMTSANDRVIIRPSGTEPKVKCYLEVILPVDADADFDQLTDVRCQANARLDLIKKTLREAVFP